jgi:DNA-damage-inducible protein D
LFFILYFCFIFASEPGDTPHKMINIMAKQLPLNTPIFEQIKHLDGNGNEYWSSRDLAKVLEYSEYRHFLPAVDRAKEACQNSGYNPADHFEDILEMVEIGSKDQPSTA